jgi:glycosyltransferase involved in cell wall biosynthesis
MKKLPLVSIVIPVYNGSNYMKEAIDSALAQTYKNIEIIVVNDGSTDDGETDRIAKSYGNKIRYFKKENGGVSTALNLAISKMKGTFFSWLSHDDLYYPDKIKTQMDYLIKNKLLNEKVITYTNYDVINEKSEVTNTVHFELYNPNDYPEYALLRGLVSGTALLIPKSAFDEYGVFDEKYRCVQDYLLFFKFMKTYKYIFIPKVTNATRVHKKQVTNVNPKVISENNMLWIKMQKELPNKAKIRLEGSLYKFYSEMYKFLINHNKYTEAHEYSLTQANYYLKKDQEKLKEILKKVGEEELFYYICNNYNKNVSSLLNRKIEKYAILASDKKIQHQLDKIINNIDIKNVLKYVIEKLEKRKKSVPAILKRYKWLDKQIVNPKVDMQIGQKNKIYKLIAYIRYYGFIKTVGIIKDKIIKKNNP